MTFLINTTTDQELNLDHPSFHLFLCKKVTQTVDLFPSIHRCFWVIYEPLHQPFQTTDRKDGLMLLDGLEWKEWERPGCHGILFDLIGSFYPIQSPSCVSPKTALVFMLSRLMTKTERQLWTRALWRVPCLRTHRHQGLFPKLVQHLRQCKHAIHTDKNDRLVSKPVHPERKVLKKSKRNHRFVGW
jgi:hypothetical protein